MQRGVRQIGIRICWMMVVLIVSCGVTLGWTRSVRAQSYGDFSAFNGALSLTFDAGNKSSSPVQADDSILDPNSCNQYVTVDGVPCTETNLTYQYVNNTVVVDGCYPTTSQLGGVDPEYGGYSFRIWFMGDNAVVLPPGDYFDVQVKFCSTLTDLTYGEPWIDTLVTASAQKGQNIAVTVTDPTLESREAFVQTVGKGKNAFYEVSDQRCVYFDPKNGGCDHPESAVLGTWTFRIASTGTKPVSLNLLQIQVQPGG